jgi:hypothetical protein
MNVMYLWDVEAVDAEWQHRQATTVARRSLRAVDRATQRPVAILLSTYNGESFLDAQLHSYLRQRHDDWTLHWRDDGSADASVRMVRRFAAGAVSGRCVFQPTGCGFLKGSNLPVTSWNRAIWIPPPEQVYRLFFTGAEMSTRERWQGIPTERSLERFREFVLPHLSVGSRGPDTKLSPHALFNYILKQL